MKLFMKKHWPSLTEIIAWFKGKEPVGDMLTIGEDCYWEHELSGCVSAFKVPNLNDLVVYQIPNQGAVFIYKIEARVLKTSEEDPGPYRFYVKQFDIIQMNKFEEWKKQLEKYPFI